MLTRTDMYPHISHILRYTLFAGFGEFVYRRSITAPSILLYNQCWSLCIVGYLLVVAGGAGDSWEQTQINPHQQGSRRTVVVPRALGFLPSLLWVLVGCFVRNLGALLADGLWCLFGTTDSEQRGGGQLVRLSKTLCGAGTGVRISYTTWRTVTTQDHCDLRLWYSLLLVKWHVFRSPLTVSFSVTAVLAFLAMSCFRLHLGSICETGVFVSGGDNLLTLHADSCFSAIWATCLCWFWGVCVAWKFLGTATAVQISRGGFVATLMVIVVLRVLTVLLGLHKPTGQLFPVRRQLRFRLLGGVDHLYTEWVLGALSGWWLFVSGALRGMYTTLTLSAGVLLAGPDPVPQLPVNVGYCWSIRLKKQTVWFKKKNEGE